MHRIIIQQAVKKTFVPKESDLRKWAKCVLEKRIKSAEVTIRIVDKAEITDLNSTYRNKKKPTNVLSFPADLPPDVKMKIRPLGDIVICADIVNTEAKLQGKMAESHWAHMIIHGALHLLGYNHEEDNDAEIMEDLEIKTLKTLGFANPYVTEK